MEIFTTREGARVPLVAPPLVVPWPLHSWWNFHLLLVAHTSLAHFQSVRNLTITSKYLKYFTKCRASISFFITLSLSFHQHKSQCDYLSHRLTSDELFTEADMNKWSFSHKFLHGFLFMSSDIISVIQLVLGKGKRGGFHQMWEEEVSTYCEVIRLAARGRKCHRRK